MNTVLVDGVEIAWEEHGPPHAPAIVFSHSLGCDMTMWRAQVEAFSPEFRTITYDTRGHGGSDAPDGPYSIPLLAGDLLAVADDAGLERFVVCGISMGGQIALWIARHHGRRLLGLVACNTGARVGTTESWQARIDGIRTAGMEGVRDQIVGRWFTPAFRRQEPERFSEFERVFTSTSADGYVACCRALAASDLTSDVADIDVPALVVGGEQDVSTPPEQAEAIAAAIPGARLVILPDAAHLSNLDRPERFNDELRAFLRIVG